MLQKIFSSLVLFTVLIGFAPAAQAGLYLEPYVGYLLSGESSNSDGTKSDLEGFDLGGRVGWQSLGLRLGGEVSLGSLKMDAAGNPPVKSTSLGVFVGFEFPILFHIYGTYFFSSSADSEITVGPVSIDAELSDGQGHKIGVGYTGLPLIAINVEMVQMSYKKSTSSGVESTLSPKQKFQALILGVSFPLSL